MKRLNPFLIGLALLGIITKNSLVLYAAAFLIVVKLLDIRPVLVFVEENGLKIGLVALLVTVLVPFANGDVGWREAYNHLRTPAGFIALIAGILATHLNEKGLNLLGRHPEVIIGLVFGSLIGVLFFKGMPVGPLMAAGIAAIVFELFRIC